MATKLDIPTVVEQSMTINAGVRGYAYIRVWGKVVTLTAEVNYGAAGTNLSLAWLQGQGNNPYKPSRDTWLSCDYYSSSTYRSEAKITTTGILIINQQEGSRDLKISGSWII